MNPLVAGAAECRTGAGAEREGQQRRTRDERAGDRPQRGPPAALAAPRDGSREGARGYLGLALMGTGGIFAAYGS